MAHPRGAHGGEKLATDSHPTESVPEASASQKLTTRCHLIQVRWTATHFDKSKYSILEFANEFLRINAVRDLSVIRKSIVGYCNLLIWTFYGEENVISNRLESQVYRSYIYA